MTSRGARRLSAALAGALLMAGVTLVPVRAEEPVLPPDPRGRMLIEIINTLERDLEALSHQKREFTRRKDELERDLALAQERISAAERELERIRRHVERLLRSLVLMREPDDLLLLVSSDRYHDLHLYRRLIRRLAVRVSDSLVRLVSRKKRIEQDRARFEREREDLAARRMALQAEIDSVEAVAARARQELSQRTEKIAAIESLFLSSPFESPYLNAPPRTPGDGAAGFPEGRQPASLADLRGRHELQIPVSPGKLIKNFEELPEPPYGTEKMVRGWILVPFTSGKKKEATDTAFVRPPHDGIAVFVGEIPGFGLTLVIDHGHGFHTVYANLYKLHVLKGEFVERDQSMAAIRTSAAGRELPYLYFELRQHRIAVDPKPWFRLRPLAPEER